MSNPTNNIDNSKFKNLMKTLRYYEKKLPSVDDYVLATITNYTDAGIFCYLDEYKIEAFMSFKDASSSRKLRVIRKEVHKNKKYILTAIKVDAEKNFIDVEKRNIDENEQFEMMKKVNFYSKIFNIFVKTFIINNKSCTLSDIYTFLSTTLWKHDKEQTKEILYKLHTESNFVVDKFNLKSEIGDKIINELKQNLDKPYFENTVTLKINSISLNAIQDIKNFLKICTDEFKTEFRSKSSPYYYCKINRDYYNFDGSVFNKDSFNHYIKNTIKKLLENKVLNLFVDIEDLECKYIINY